jgi:hypothetical protein
MDMPIVGTETADDWHTDTAAALAGGNTADGNRFEAMQIARYRGLVVLVHAEKGDARGQSVYGEEADLELAVRALHELTPRTLAWATKERSA